MWNKQGKGLIGAASLVDDRMKGCMFELFASSKLHFSDRLKQNFREKMKIVKFS